jgi:hypothetical protein
MEVLQTDGSGRGGAPESGRVAWSMPPAGWRMFVPGWPQWRWGQHGRGFVLFGSFLSAVAMAAFTWGTPTGLALLTFAFFAHLTSLADALRQSAFPALGRRVAISGAAAVLGLGIYGPVLTLASVTAWPSVRGRTDSEGYLVNRWAFRSSDPRRADWVWYRSSPWGEPRLGRVVAGSGQEVVWAGNRLRVDGLSTKGLGAPFRSVWPPNEVSYRVPDRHVLVLPEGSPTNHQASEGLMIVARDQVLGRAWAKFYPVRERRFL